MPSAHGADAAMFVQCINEATHDKMEDPVGGFRLLLLGRDRCPQVLAPYDLGTQEPSAATPTASPKDRQDWQNYSHFISGEV